MALVHVLMALVYASRVEAVAFGQRWGTPCYGSLSYCDVSRHDTRAALRVILLPLSQYDRPGTRQPREKR